jgi:GAF domain-containing protein
MVESGGNTMLSTSQERTPYSRGRAAFSALAPVAGLRAARVRRALGAVPRPHDAPLGHARGHDVDRVLILGCGAAVGWGVSTHELALPGTLARGLTALTGRGSTVDLVARPELRVTQAASALADRDLLRYDAIVLVLGSVEAAALTPSSEWARGLAGLLDDLAVRAPGAPVLVAGVRPVRVTGARRMLDRIEDGHAATLDDAAEALCVDRASATFVPASGRVAFPTDPDGALAGYAEWGDALADRIVPLISAARAGSAPRERRRRRDDREAGTDHARRQSVVDTFASAARTSEVDLDHILSLARRAFKTDAALVTVLDRDRQFHLAAAGTGLSEVPWSARFCEFALRDSEATVVPDTRADERFAASPFLNGDRSMRFYAGFPIEAPSGERVGALCVLDSQPRRRADDIDRDLLRELAIMAQREMWRFLPSPEE